MNIPNPPPTEPDDSQPSRQERLQAEAIEETRRRFREREGRSAAEAQLAAAARPRRRPWDLTPDRNQGFLYELFAGRMIIGLVLTGLWLLLSAVFWLADNLRMPIYLLIRALDVATGARALPGAPFVMWTLWGAIFGGTLGYWLVAPVYGNRENRSFLLLLPLLAMTLIAALLWAFVR